MNCLASRVKVIGKNFCFLPDRVSRPSPAVSFSGFSALFRRSSTGSCCKVKTAQQRRRRRHFWGFCGAERLLRLCECVCVCECYMRDGVCERRCRRRCFLFSLAQAAACRFRCCAKDFFTLPRSHFVTVTIYQL